MRSPQTPQILGAFPDKCSVYNARDPTNMNKSTTSSRPMHVPEVRAILKFARESKARMVLAVLGGQMLGLSLLHHAVGIWEWDLGRRFATVLLVGLVAMIALIVAAALNWKELTAITPRRWIAFGVPALLISIVLARHIFHAPETEHDLRIVPRIESTTGEVRIREIRISYGNTLDLNDLPDQAGWSRQNGLLIAIGEGAGPLHLKFRGPVGELVRISFITSNSSGAAEVGLDGKVLRLNLLGPDGNETRARLEAGYHWGKLNPLFLPFLGVVDSLAILALLAAIWSVHELGVARRSPPAAGVVSGIRAHIPGLVLVFAVGLLFHAVSFVSVPLRVSKDGPSYLQGAVSFAEHGNFDGASSYRGPGTTFIFAPSLMAFGRNPIGVKLTLHLLAIGCGPLAYAIGWSLAGRRWVALASGLLTAGSPDLLGYANEVLSEVPDMFFLLLLAATLLYAMRRFSLQSSLACLLAGSLAVLVRPDNSAAFGIGIAFLGLTVLFNQTAPEKTYGRYGGGRLDFRSLLISGVVATLPLIAWSAHNLRIHRFFGISEYVGGVVYDGWIYYGENSGIRLLDRDSSAVREIDATIPILVGAGEQPTSWTVYYALLAAGRSSGEAFSLLGRASTDSIRRHPDRAWQVLMLKLQDAPIPAATLPGPWYGHAGSYPYADLTSQYFDDEPWLLKTPVDFELWSRDIVQRTYGPFYSLWLAFGILALWLSTYRGPALIWLGYVTLAANALLLPVVVGVASWRYLLPGIMLLGPATFASAEAMLSFAADCTFRGHARVQIPGG